MVYSRLSSLLICCEFFKTVMHNQYLRQSSTRSDLQPRSDRDGDVSYTDAVSLGGGEENMTGSVRHDSYVSAVEVV
jgi:hypothetical protein